MMGEKITLNDYPYNLLMGIMGKKMLKLPHSLTKDVQAGIAYALFTLDEIERDVLDKKYRFGISLNADQQQIERKALRKLSYPCRWNYICYGVTGYLKKNMDEAKRKGFSQGYQDGYKVGKEANGTSQEDSGVVGVLDLPIETMALSVRVCNALRGSGCKVVSDVAAQNLEQIQIMRNIGEKGVQEVIHALHSYGIFHTEWELF